MRLTMLDRIVELKPGQRIAAVKCLSLTEDYLKDHFPRFPVMPGVLMLEAMYQAAAWLVRATDGFQHSLVSLVEANNVKYSDFVEPGRTLKVSAELLKHEQSVYRFQCQGEIEANIAVRGRLILQATRLDQTDPEATPIDERMIHSLRDKFQVLYPNSRSVETERDAN